jgi:hypothetical protein
MNTLTMALAAALLAGSAPEKVSGEMDQKLDLRGYWVGTWEDATTPKGGVRMKAEQLGDSFSFAKDPDILIFACLPMEDEGRGRMTLEDDAPSVFLGIYRQTGDRLLICLGTNGLNRPTSFRPGKGQSLLTLYRVRRGN